MIGAVLSAAVERRLGKLPDASPLAAGSDGGTGLIDVCYPSLFLARALSPVEIRKELGGEQSRERFVRRAMLKLEKILQKSEHDIHVAKRGAALPFAVLAQLEERAFLDAVYDLRKKVPEAAGIAKRLRGMSLRRRRLFISHEGLRHLTEIALFSPSVCLLRTLLRVYAVEDEQLLVREERGRSKLQELLLLCVGPVRHYFNRPVVQAIVRRHGGGGTYTRRVLGYAQRAHLAEVMDEYVALLKNPLQNDTFKQAVAHLGRVFQLGQGRPKLNRIKRGKLQLAKVPAASHFAMAFGEELESEGKQGGVTQRRTKLREAFNSPFWPFVLATTSVGQEGLDFHLYCRDVVHWNLPTNPVDFEQREGRVNRYGGLWIRRAIAADYPLDQLLKEAKLGSPWPIAFDAAERRDRTQGYKHGLFPYWVYEPKRDPARQYVPGTIKRHVFFHDQSEDKLRYRRLMHALHLYRLVFGQPNQRDLLRSLEDEIRKSGEREEDIYPRLPAYMVNLSPFREDYAKRKATDDAKSMLSQRAKLEALIDDVERLRAKHEELRSHVDLQRLLDEVTHAMSSGVPPRLQAIATLEYLRNPYDNIFDDHRPHGFEDDLELIRLASASLRAGAAEAE